MINDLLLLSGNDIPIEKAQMILHQPTIKEIGLIGEDTFFYGCQLLRFSKEMLNTQDKNNLKNYSDFDILMSIIANQEDSLKDSLVAAKQVLTLLFPNYDIKRLGNQIVFSKPDEAPHIITSEIFEDFKKIITKIFCLSKDGSEGEYNPQGTMAQSIAEKLKQRHQKLASMKGNSGQKISIYNRYASILAIGLSTDLNCILNYTVFQIMDQFNRYSLKLGYDIYVQSKMAGASGMKEPEDWMKNLYEK